MSHDHEARPSMRPRVDSGVAALWASAFVIGGMLVSQAGRFGAPDQAYAGNVAETGQIRLLTADAGGGEEVLAIVNIVDETIAIYSIQNQRSIELYQTARLADLFDQARGGGGGSGGRGR